MWPSPSLLTSAVVNHYANDLAKVTELVNTMRELACRRIINRLDDAALLTFHVTPDNPERGTVTMHDLQRDFVRFSNKMSETDHQRLLEGLETRFGGRLFADGDRPGGDYFRRFMVHHLIGAGRQDDLFELLINPNWIEHRLRAGDQVFDLIADYDRALASERPP